MRRRARRSIGIGTAGALVTGVVVLWAVPPASRVVEPGPLSGPGSIAGGTTVRGAFHVHSRRSDGSGTVDEIAAAASSAGLDFVILTDHGDGTARRPPSYRGGVLVIEAVEISTDGGHYVALGLPPAPYPLGGDARGVVEDVRRLGGFGVVAHPTSPRPALAWSDWSLPVDGIEWLNGDSQWRDDTLPDLLRAAAGYWFRAPESLASLLSRPDRALARWDALASGRPVVGLGAADAHARLGFGTGDDEHGGGVGGVEVRFPGYEETFRAFALRVELDRPLTGDAPADGANVVGQVRAGRVYTAIDALAGPVRFAFAGAAAGGGRVRMGERAPPGRGVTLTASVAGPEDVAIRLLRNGRPVARETGRTLAFPVAPGGAPAAWRVEVFLPKAPGRPPVPWIVSNPVYTGAAAARPAALPAEPAAEALAAPGGRWQVERRPDARATLTEEGAGFRFAFTLGGSAGTYAAAARTLPPGALANAGAFRFEVEATRPMRVSLQLRRPDEAAGSVRWRRSFHAGPDRRVVRVPVGEFEPAWWEVPPRPDLAAVDALLIIVDTVNTLPGASGVLTVGAVRVEPRPTP